MLAEIPTLSTSLIYYFFGRGSYNYIIGTLSVINEYNATKLKNVASISPAFLSFNTMLYFKTNFSSFDWICGVKSGLESE